MAPGRSPGSLNRIGALEVAQFRPQGEPCLHTGWVDYQPGDLPRTLLKRSAQLLHLYENAAKESSLDAGTP